MSFRFEEKISVNKLNAILFLNFLEKKGLKKLHKFRNINSIYFDNINHSMFYQSEEGVRPRQKIRLRNYNFINQYNLEKKISSDEGRYKISKRVTEKEFNKYIKYGFFSNIYGACYPLVFVNYTREYFELGKVRITYDTNIKYQSFSNKKIVYDDNRRVFEIKCAQFSDLIDINNFLGPKNRFSKYAEALLKLNLN